MNSTKYCKECDDVLFWKNEIGLCRSCNSIGERNAFYGRKHSEKTSKKISFVLRNNPKTEEQKYNKKCISCDTMLYFGYIYDDCSECRKIVQYCVECGKEKRSNVGIKCGSCVQKGRKVVWSEERKIAHLDMISKVHAGKISTLRGIPRSEDVKKKISENTKGKCHKELSIEDRLAISTRLKEEYKIGKRKPVNHINKNTEPHRKIIEILTNMNFNVESEFCLYDDISNRTYFYDVKINNSNILIEVDGCYWHCRDYYDGRRDWNKLTEREKLYISNDIRKNELAKKLGYKLIRVWEDEEEIVWRIM